jgi:hypothetical protein
MNHPNEPEHVGEVGEKITLTGVVRTATRVNGFTPRSPERALIVIDADADAGAAVAKLVSSARWAYSVERGDRITVTGTVKAHTEWRGTKQTVLTRATRRDPRQGEFGPADPDIWEAVNPAEVGPRPFPGTSNPLATPQTMPSPIQRQPR